MIRRTSFMSMAALLVGAALGCSSGGGSGASGHTASSSGGGSGPGGAGGSGSTSDASSTTTTSSGPGSTSSSSSTGSGGGGAEYAACPTDQFPPTKQLTFGSGGDTHVIDADTTWTKDNLYIVVGRLLIEGPNNPTLTVDAGVTVCFAYDPGTDADGGIRLAPTDKGALQMNGTPAEPITLTSLGGIDAFWTSIDAGPNYTSLSLSYVDFYNASEGGGQGPGAIHARANAGEVPPINLDHVTMHRLNAGQALDIQNHVGLTPSSQVTVTSFTPGASAPQQYAVIQSDPVSAGSFQPGMFVVDGAGVPAELRHIRFTENNLTTSVTLRDVGLPYHTYAGDFSVYQSSSSDPIPVLTVSAGVTWKFDAQSSLLVGGPSGYSGDLVLSGTASEPVVLSAIDSTSSASYWGGVHFNATAAVGYGFDPSTTKIHHARLEFGGNSPSWYEINCFDPNGASYPAAGLITIRGTGAYMGPGITNTTFSHSVADGVRARASKSGDYLAAPDYTAASAGNTFDSIAGAAQLMTSACP